MRLDTTYNFQAETEPKDADRYSSTLQEYHRILWSKELFNGEMFELKKIDKNRLYHKSNLGEFYLSSDRAIPTFWKWKKMEHIIKQVPKESLDYFINITETIGAITIWPCNRIEKKATINGAKGLIGKISDRLDLTIECIRRYYLGQKSPLYNTLKLYDDFFKLFGDFRGYVDFFLFQDAVSNDYNSVRIAPPFDAFETVPVPTNLDEYLAYMKHTTELIEGRNRRIEKLF